MRIQKIRFQNLNSLQGKWEIDLTVPAYTSEGIFAIVGPTGAGKTTILDAICLALYGATPRLNKVSKGDNEIMSRQSGECSAEVDFSTTSGEYTCFWGQHRARKKAGGELQSPRHELFSGGKLLESSLRGVPEQIEKITGMDFERFTRSMLLAQGGFAIFLQASPSERAPILEQITGSEIYSQISIEVHKRRNSERDKLDLLQAELGGLQVLDEAEEQLVQQQLNTQQTQQHDLQQQRQLNQTALAWREKQIALQQHLDELAQQMQASAQRQIEFAPELAKLQRALAALEYAADLARLDSLREQQHNEARALRDLQQDLPQALTAWQTSQQQFLSSETNWKTTREQFAQQQPLLQQVRELDVNLAAQLAPLQHAQQQLAEQTQQLQQNQQRQNEIQTQLQQSTQQQETLAEQITLHQTDDALATQLAGIRAQSEAAIQADQQQKQQKKAWQNAQKSVQSALQKQTEQTQILNQSQTDHAAQQQALSQQKDALYTLLAGKSIEDYHQQQLVLNEQLNALKQLQQALQHHLTAQQKLAELTLQQQGLHNKQQQLAQAIAQSLHTQALLQQQQTLLETQLRLLSRIADLSQARQQLQDGEACPLCGALEHPFAQGQIPTPDQTELDLQHLRQTLNDCQNQLAAQQIEQAKIEQDLAHNAEQQTHWQGSEQAVHQSASLCGIAAEQAFTLAEIEQKISLSKQHAAQLKQTIEQAQKHSKKLEQQQQLAHTAQQLLANAAREMELAKQQVAHCQQNEQTAASQLQHAEQQFQQIWQPLCQSFEHYSIDISDTSQLNDNLQQLAQRQAAQQQRLQQQQKLAQDIQTLATEHKALQQQHAQQQSTVLQSTQHVDELKAQYQQLQYTRHQLFGEQDPNTISKAFEQKIKLAEMQMEQSRKQQQQAEQHYQKQLHSQNQLQTSINQREQEIAAQQQHFLAQIAQIQLQDEASYRAACLPEAERKQLSEQAQQLEQARLALHSKIEQLHTQQNALAEQALSELSYEDLQLDQQKIDAEYNQLQQEIGALQQKLNNNASLKQTQQKRLIAIQAQKQELQRWADLHELIGSEKGQKYRNFAQGLTFEVMISHANAQLRKMSDRYLLVRDTTQPLELNVIDSYQAGDIRSTKNLSGGESFIISLALALGLAQMSSKSVRVDSLFLDEGFGTLDDTALDIALDTLSSLQQTGKLIGIISHIPALKERIRTQIQVVPQTGGRSKLLGAGCKSL